MIQLPTLGCKNQRPHLKFLIEFIPLNSNTFSNKLPNAKSSHIVHHTIRESVVPVEQSGLVQLKSQMQELVSLWNVPWPEQCSGHIETCVSQFDPVQPEVQWH